MGMIEGLKKTLSAQAPKTDDITPQNKVSTGSEIAFPKFISLNSQNPEGEKLEIKFKRKESLLSPGQSKTEKKPD